MEDFAAAAPSVEALSQRIDDTRRPRSTRVFTAAAIGAVIVAVALLATVLARLDRHRAAPPVGTDGPTWAAPCAPGVGSTFSTFTVGHVAGLADTAGSLTACSGYSQRWLYNPNGAWLGVVTVYERGVFDTSKLNGARRVSGHGITGYDVDLAGRSTGDIPCYTGTPGGSCAKLQALAWQYAPGSWALVIQDQGGSTTTFFGAGTGKELEVAAATRPASREPLRVPLRFGYLPSGLKLMTVSGEIPQTPPTPVTRSLGLGANLSFAPAGRGACTGCPAELDVNISAGHQKDPKIDGPGHRLIIAGHPAWLSVPSQLSRLSLRVDTGQWQVIMTPGTHLSQADLIRIATAIDYAPQPADVATWPEASTATPR